MQFLQRFRDIAAAVAGGGAFLLLHLGGGLGVVPALMLTLLAYVGTRLALAPPKRPFDQVKPGSAMSAFVPLATELIEEGTAKLDRLEELIARTRGQDVRERARAILKRGRALVENLKTDPADANRSRRLLTYYLDTVVKIMDHYNVIASQGGQDHASLERVATMLAEVEQVFIQQNDKMLANDLLGLDTELGLLETTLKSERQT